MKELSIEEKATRYDDAIKKTKSLYEVSEPLSGCNVIIETIFPELKESEEERIRKYLIRYIDNTMKSSELKSKLLAWLEKQGEQKPTLPKWKYKKDNTTLLKDSLVLNKCGHMAKLSSGAIVSDVWVLDYDELAKLPKEELEEQGEQKPIIEMITPEESLGIDSETYNDIVNTCIFGENKPKFKVGDWIVNRLGNIWHIDSFDAKNYQVTNTKGDHNYFPINIQDRMHLWTIADAKDGDVLAAYECLVLFKKLDELNIKCYCTYHYMGFNTSFYVDTLQNKDAFHPATKEQRDLLFQKMKEFGYEWDEENKELKKIEQKPTQETEPFEAEHGKYYYCIKDYFCGGRKQASKGDVVQALRGLPIMGLKDASEYFLPVNSIKCNSAWSEEDEKEYKYVLKFVDNILNNCGNKKDYDHSKRCYDWLKSLKDKIKGE